jgi:putative Holliday junction resolvase
MNPQHSPELPLAPTPTAGKFLALDVGTARIGIAVCDPLQLAARPIQVLERRSRNQDFALLAQTVERENVVAVICGLPLNMDGSEGAQAATTRKWAARLAQALRAMLGRPVPVLFWDERLSSYEAREVLRTRGDTIGEDAAAAAVILQAYLDARRAGDNQDYGSIELPPK